MTMMGTYITCICIVVWISIILITRGRHNSSTLVWIQIKKVPKLQ